MNKQHSSAGDEFGEHGIERPGFAPVGGLEVTFRCLCCCRGGFTVLGVEEGGDGGSGLGTCAGRERGSGGIERRGAEHCDGVLFEGVMGGSGKIGEMLTKSGTLGDEGTGGKIGHGVWVSSCASKYCGGDKQRENSGKLERPMRRYLRERQMLSDY